jgi:hypothetical protein
VYLDEDVPKQVKEKLEGYAKVVTAEDARRQGWKDAVVYAQTVRDKFDYVITCNTEGKTAFMSECLRQLACRQKDLPIPVYELHEPNSNHWPKIEKQWGKHEARIRQELTDLGTKHEQRRAEVVTKLESLEKAAEQKRERGPEQVVEPQKKITRER